MKMTCRLVCTTAVKRRQTASSSPSPPPSAAVAAGALAARVALEESRHLARHQQCVRAFQERGGDGVRLAEEEGDAVAADARRAHETPQNLVKVRKAVALCERRTDWTGMRRASTVFPQPDAPARRRCPIGCPSMRRRCTRASSNTTSCASCATSLAVGPWLEPPRPLLSVSRSEKRTGRAHVPPKCFLATASSSSAHHARSTGVMRRSQKRRRPSCSHSRATKPGTQRESSRGE